MIIDTEAKLFYVALVAEFEQNSDIFSFSQVLQMVFGLG